ncbi:hypothetical protein [Nitrincola sp. MINF-07-Sa-05]|uniref:hypothetical protein n=1 Tax=Nitrincola salilacus TaxID=3400273 RepID=UPI0039180CEC
MIDNKVKSGVIALSLLYAANAWSSPVILESLANQGGVYKTIDEPELKNVRGSSIVYASAIYSGAFPMATQGKLTHMVNYLGWGSQSDYRSYYYQSYSWAPHEEVYVHYDGLYFSAFGDEWRADMSSPINQWSYANSVVKEWHYNLWYSDGTPSPYYARATSWNRPISTFSW